MLFGQVTSGMSVVQKINDDGSASGRAPDCHPPDADRHHLREKLRHLRKPGVRIKVAKSKQFDAEPPMGIDPSKRYTAQMETSKATMTIALDPVAAPRTVNSFVFLARNGYYDGVVFHRIIPGFVVQGGDPTGTGTGGPGYKFADELPAAGTLRDRFARDGERRAEHQREPVLHHQRRRRGAAAAELLAFRQGRLRARDRRGARCRRAPESGSPKERVTDRLGHDHRIE